MIQTIKRTLIIFSCFILINCTTTGGGMQSDQSKPGDLFVFSEKSSGSVPALIRIFINEDFLRIDDDTTPDDYILFDRKNKIINNVVADGKTIFVIKYKKLDVKPPIEINYEHVKKESGAVTNQSNGKKAFYYKFTANGKPCYNVVVMEDYMPLAVAAFKEFRLVLAGEHSKTMSRIPGQEYDACDLALNIFESTRHLQYGFPVREWDSSGYQRFLVDVKRNIVVSDELLTLPQEYKSYSISE